MPDTDDKKKKLNPDETPHFRGEEEILLAPSMPQEYKESLEKFRTQLLRDWSLKKTQDTIAFSVTGWRFESSGDATLLTYASELTNEGGGWGHNSVFIAPLSGLYYFAVHFMKSTSEGGTKGDVSVWIAKNGEFKGQAWSGVMNAAKSGDKGNGVCIILLRLQAGDWIQTYVVSAGNKKRIIYLYNFVGYRTGN